MAHRPNFSHEQILGGRNQWRKKSTHIYWFHKKFSYIPPLNTILVT